MLRRDIFVGDSDVAAAAVVQQLREYAAMGFGQVMVRHITGDHARMLESFDRIGRHVIPDRKSVV